MLYWTEYPVTITITIMITEAIQRDQNNSKMQKVDYIQLNMQQKLNW